MNEQLHRSVLRLSQLSTVEDGAQYRFDPETVFSQADSAHLHCMWQTMSEVDSPVYSAQFNCHTTTLIACSTAC